ncbi:hypothetical protein OUY22_16775 [Nonomuraea sp. MCN248]|uniref:Uncharacterized protein n=1 Tax=Nonomuraea corallina TaxID=2989783 RepID=A0ABT4SDM9_9ACTN|nr:hypothetical protein [Nonomuraea corallina]MDA0635075.1 hypothetical protein [Nonomuraea corallina]
MRALRRIMGFDAKGMASLVLWVTRRRDGVPPRALAASYSRAQSATMILLLVVVGGEAVVVEVVLRAFDVPAAIRVPILVLDLYGLLFGFAVVAACVTRPHVVTDRELRIRYGAFFDLRIPRELVASVRTVRAYNESGLVTVDGERLTVAVASQVNVVVELSEPVTAVRPLGAEAAVTTVRFFADEPGPLVALMRQAAEPAA